MKTSSTIVDVHKTGGDSKSLDSILSTAFSTNGKFSATASSSGTVAVQALDSKIRSTLFQEGGCTVVRFAQTMQDPVTSESTVLTASPLGFASIWRVAVGTSVDHVGVVEEKGNEIMSAAFDIGRNDRFATGGSDATLRIYDVADGEIKCSLTVDQGITIHGQPTLGPPRKIMSTTFVDSNLVLVGGWETSLLLFDLRSRSAVRTFDGARISGDCVDICGNSILAASDRPKDQVELFDLTTGNKIISHTVETLPFAARLFGRPSKLGCWVAGTSANRAVAIDLQSGKVLADLYDFPEALYAMDVCPTDPQVVVLGGSHESSYRIKADFTIV